MEQSALSSHFCFGSMFGCTVKAVFLGCKFEVHYPTFQIEKGPYKRLKVRKPKSLPLGLTTQKVVRGTAFIPLLLHFHSAMVLVASFSHS